MSYSWSTRVTIPDPTPYHYKSFMEMIYRVSQLAKVPKDAKWSCIQSGDSYEVIARYEKRIWPLFEPEEPVIRFKFT